MNGFFETIEGIQSASDWFELIAGPSRFSGDMSVGCHRARWRCIIALMKTLKEIKQILKVEKPFLAEEYGVIVIGVFGSYVRGEQRADSDLDILIELERPPRISLIGLVELEHYLSDTLGVQVDMAIQENLKKRIGKRILNEVVPV